ncbi:sensor histidine kinase [Streptomyces sp. NPDC057889]|uniref:sensor histidine kinase n=1 Tax=unclassified Streptomyces TaxID=2593676 RepID=UPI00369EB20D
MLVAAFPETTQGFLTRSVDVDEQVVVVGKLRAGGVHALYDNGAKSGDCVKFIGGQISCGPVAAPVGGVRASPVATTRDGGVKVDVEWRGERRPLPKDIELSAFRIIQEGLTNVVRHAGTQECRVVIDFQEDELSVEITDDGQGPTPAGNGYGITGMRERAFLLHGQFTAGPRPEGGFRVAARLPVQAGMR